ncbi:MAG: TIGR03016 family PEP-CTERM system-associated outer membrane protein [Mycobacterium sp.]|nr:TIGR03016 family PEP-CTERM system-associated outer membrane protein [Mycobacterium sp.]
MTRRLCGGLSVAAALLLVAPPFVPSARAQLLPDTGTTVQVGALRQQLEGLLRTGANAPATPGWTMTPALGAEERWTDHLLTADGTGKSSFITAFLPSVLISGETERITTTINYAPTLEYYSNGRQGLISQDLNAASKITVLPEHLFLDLRGFAAVQPTYGGYGPASTAAVSSHDETQTLGFTAHPYLRQSFGDLGLAELGAMLSRVSQHGLSNNSLPSGQLQPIATVPGQALTSEQEYFSLTSGPAFGRTIAGLQLSANQDAGSGVFNNAHQDSAVVNLGYLVTRSVTALASFGYDDVHYAGTPPFNFSGLRWSVGTHWIPNPDSSVTVNYGRQEGVESAQVDACYALTARTRVYVRYSEGITSGLQQVLNGINGSTLDTAGNPVASNGTPVQINNGFYGVQNNLVRLTDTSVTMTTVRDRDAISVTFSYQQSHQVSAASAANAGNQNSTGWYGTLTWQRSLWPDLNASAYVQWGTSQYTPANGGQNSDTLVFSLSLNYVVSRTVSAYARYSWTRQTYTGLGGAFPELPTNLIVIGARKTF